MAQSDDDASHVDGVQDTYIPDQDRSLTDAILDAIEDCKGDDLTRTDFVLFEDIDPDALNSLFRHDAQPRTTLTFTTDDVEVKLWGDGGVKIHVTKRITE